MKYTTSLILGLTVILGACGGEDANTSTTTSNTIQTPSVTDTPPAPVEPILKLLSDNAVVTAEWRGDAGVDSGQQGLVLLADTSENDFSVREYRYEEVDVGSEMTLDFTMGRQETADTVSLVRLRHLGEGIDIKRNFLIDTVTGEYKATGFKTADVAEEGDTWRVKLTVDVPNEPTQTRLVIFPAAAELIDSGLAQSATGKAYVGPISIRTLSN